MTSSSVSGILRCKVSGRISDRAPEAIETLPNTSSGSSWPPLVIKLCVICRYRYILSCGHKKLHICLPYAIYIIYDYDITKLTVANSGRNRINIWYSHVIEAYINQAFHNVYFSNQTFHSIFFHGFTKTIIKECHVKCNNNLNALTRSAI